MPEPVDRALPLEDALTQSASVGSDADDTLAGPRHSPPPPAPVFGPPVAPGEVGALGPYRIVRLLGRGGMGAVYAALDTRLQRKLALKVMLPAFTANPVAKERFLREARAAAQVSHDNVVTVYEADERDGVPYIAMQFLEGYPLDVYLKRKGSPSIPQILRIAREAAAGLAAAHHLGLIHRDIKPGNLWLEAPHGRVKVLDFGLARPVDADVELTKSGAVVGTPAYMSAEQARGEKVDRRSDLFSLGAVLYRLCSGRLPFHGPTTMAVLMALGTQEPPPVRDLNPAVPDALAALIHQLLAKDPAGRPQTADEVVKRLRAIARELEAPRTAPAEPGPQPAYVPIQVTAQPEANPFAGLDAESVTEVDRARPAEGRPAEGRPAEGRPAPVRKEPRRTWAPAVAGFAALLAALVVAGVVIVIRNKDGTETRIEAPAGATVTVKGKDGKTLGKFGPEKPLAADPDRRAAEWALSIGGAVSANGEELAIKNAAELPEGRFTLTAVDLHHNPKVTDAGLAHFKDCKALIYLNLDGTPVTDAGLVNFRECKELNEIYLLGTSVTDAGLAHFKDCKELRVLALHSTAVSADGLANFQGRKGLVYLDLGNTKVTDAGLANFKDCKELRALSLNNLPLTDAGLVYFKDCKRLTALVVYNTRVTDAGLAHFQGCKGLKTLHLGDTKVTDTGLAHFKDCKSLTDLRLYRTKVTDAGLAHFKDCKALTFLHLGTTTVTDAGLANFKDCKELSHLDLNGTPVTDAGLATFKHCKSLKGLDLRGTKVTAKGVAEFHAAVPGCKIEHDGGTIKPIP